MTVETSDDVRTMGKKVEAPIVSEKQNKKSIMNIEKASEDNETIDK